MSLYSRLLSWRDKEIALIKKKISGNDRVDELVDRVIEKSLKSVLQDSFDSSPRL